MFSCLEIHFLSKNVGLHLFPCIKIPTTAQHQPFSQCHPVAMETGPDFYCQHRFRVSRK